jgi:hypothetical protein
LSRQDKDKGREKRKDSSDSLSKYDLKQIQRKRLSEAMQTGLKVAIDCSFEDTLSPKEICKLSGQVGRLYGSNKKSEKPFHLYLVGLNSSGRLVQECRRRHEGFDSYMIEFSEKLAWDVTEKNNIVFLTPDSNNGRKSPCVAMRVSTPDSNNGESPCVAMHVYMYSTKVKMTWKGLNMYSNIQYLEGMYLLSFFLVLCLFSNSDPPSPTAPTTNNSCIHTF